MTPHDLVRFEARVHVEPNTGCWIWRGAIATPGGYGTMKVDGRTRLAHRLSYEYFKGQIHDGLDIDHLCRTRCCVNPDHLEAVTRQVNLNRGIIHNRTKTHCPKGHPYSGDNLLVRPHGNGGKQRTCLACHREMGRVRAQNYRGRHGQRNRSA